jgi:PHP family Zn ribbon phosphoesterase
MGLDCLTCGKRFYLPPGEQRWLEKRCGGSITKPVRVRRARCVVALPPFSSRVPAHRM